MHKLCTRIKTKTEKEIHSRKESINQEGRVVVRFLRGFETMKEKFLLVGSIGSMPSCLKMSSSVDEWISDQKLWGSLCVPLGSVSVGMGVGVASEGDEVHFQRPYSLNNMFRCRAR